MEEQKQQLKELGFKKKWFKDKSGYWWIKPTKVREFKGYFYCDYKFCFLMVNTLIHKYDNVYSKSDAIVWKGSYNAFIKKVKEYGNI